MTTFDDATDTADLDDLFGEDSDMFPQGEDDLFVDGDDAELQLDADPEQSENAADSWKVLIVDDEPEIHKVTTLALDGVRYMDRPLTYISAYSATEAEDIVKQHDDIAMILLDVVMEEDDSGLKFVHFVRQEMANHFVRIILRTGQPGQAPEESVIVDYDINDYKSKVELTDTKLFSAVVTALRSYQHLQIIEENRQQLKIFSDAAYQFVPVEFLQRLQKKSLIDIRLGDFIQMPMSILFSDIRSFTTLSESMTPRDNFTFLNSYLHKMEPIIQEHSGFIDKYLGDGIMALFDNADHAAQAAMTMIQALRTFNREQEEKGLTTIDVGYGINSGVVALGTVGGFKRMDGTVISNSVNLAARIEGLTKLYGVNTLVSEFTYLQLSAQQRKYSRFLDIVSVKGKNQLVCIFELFAADPEPLRDQKLQSSRTVADALVLLQSGMVPEAQNMLLECLAKNPTDQPLEVFIERCEELIRCPINQGDLLGQSLTELKLKSEQWSDESNALLEKIDASRKQWLEDHHEEGSTALLQFMATHAQTLFPDEEAAMEASGYPNFAVHKKHHKSFRERLRQLADIRASVGESVFAVLLLSQALDWFFSHIATRDAQYARFLQKNS